MKTREQLEEMYRDLGADRHDGGMYYTLDDHIRQARNCQRLGFTLTDWAAALGVPEDYARAVMEFALSDRQDG
jgi:hypothetical protein